MLFVRSNHIHSNSKTRPKTRNLSLYLSTTNHSSIEQFNLHFKSNPQQTIDNSLNPAGNHLCTLAAPFGKNWFRFLIHLRFRSSHATHGGTYVPAPASVLLHSINTNSMETHGAIHCEAYGYECEIIYRLLRAKLNLNRKCSRTVPGARSHRTVFFCRFCVAQCFPSVRAMMEMIQCETWWCYPRVTEVSGMRVWSAATSNGDEPEAAQASTTFGPRLGVIAHCECVPSVCTEWLAHFFFYLDPILKPFAKKGSSLCVWLLTLQVG